MIFKYLILTTKKCLKKCNDYTDSTYKSILKNDSKFKVDNGEIIVYYAQGKNWSRIGSTSKI